jgi:hypothetical protein
MKETIKNLEKEKQNLVNRLDDVSTPLEALKRFYSKIEVQNNHKIKPYVTIE